jgi:trigger factor
VVEKMFGDQIRREVLARLVEHSFHHAVEEQRLDVVGAPEIDADGLTPGESLTYSATIDVRPVIAIGKTEGVQVTRPQYDVTDADVERVLESMREAQAQLRPIEDRNVVESGDVVTLNLTTRLPDQEPQHRDGVMVEAGAGAFPQALERQLVGQHRGARPTLSVPYPADYGNPALAGKSVTFDVEIVELKAKELPPLDDDFARDHGRADSLAALRATVREDLERHARTRAESAVQEAVLEQLLARHPFDVPPSLVDRRCDAMLSALDVRLPSGPEGQQVLARLRGEVRPRAEREVRADLLLDALAAARGVTIDDTAVEAEIDALAQRQQQAPERIRAFYDRPEARQALRTRLGRERALAAVMSEATIVPLASAKDVARP